MACKTPHNGEIVGGENPFEIILYFSILAFTYVDY